MFTWNGQEINTIGRLLEGAIQAMRQDRAQEFLKLYRAVNDHADANLGYIFGYCDSETRRELHAAYLVEHPIFGTNY